MTGFGRTGEILEALLLEGDSSQSEGVYRLDHWAVRLGCDPHSDRARMATLHEMYHGLLNDSTAYGTLLHAAGVLVREQPEEPRYAALLEDLLRGRPGVDGRAATLGALVVHETYATYSSVYLLGHGRSDPALIEPYAAEYHDYLRAALVLAEAMPNPAIGFQLVQSAVRAAMQPDCLALFASTPPEHWIRVAAQPEVSRPDSRFAALTTAAFRELATRELANWAATQESPLIREVLDSRPATDADYERLIENRLDPATDAIGACLYEICRAELLRMGLSCLAFNGHQAETAAVLARADSVLLPHRRGRLAAAREGSLVADLLSGFAQEQLVLFPRPLRSRWLWLDDIPEERWPELLVGSNPHVLLAVRPRWRLVEQYDFGASGPPLGDAADAVVALRRRSIEANIATVEHLLVRDPEVLVRLSARLSGKGIILVSCALSALAVTDWQDSWLPTLRRQHHMSVLVDLDPFEYVRAWSSQDGLQVSFAGLRMKDGEQERIALALLPDTEPPIVFLAPCTSVFCSAMAVELRALAAAGAQFVEETSAFTAQMPDLTLVLSHLFREEPWFDFRAARGA